MRILTTPRVLKRPFAGLVTLAALLAAGTIVGVLTASPASAATCVTSGHAYLTQPGRVIFSGYEGDQRFGVPTVSYSQGTQSFRLGGNGIRPGTSISFLAQDTNTGVLVGPVRPQNTYVTSPARHNCVVNEEGPFVFSLAPGSYRILAFYTGGNSGQFINDVVANLQVQAPPPPPPYDPYDPGYGYDPCAGAPFGGCYVG